MPPDDVLPGVAALVPEVRLEVLLDDGTRLVVLLEPLGPRRRRRPGGGPAGAVRSVRPGDDRERLTLEVANTSTRVVRVSATIRSSGSTSG